MNYTCKRHQMWSIKLPVHSQLCSLVSCFC